jgi:hypothetical protein
VRTIKTSDGREISCKDPDALLTIGKVNALLTIGKSEENGNVT